MFAPSYFGKLLGCKSHTLKQPKAVEFAFKAICSRFGHFSAESDWIIMVRARVEINKELMRLNKIQKQKPLRLNLRVLEKLATPFRIELKNRFGTLKDDEPSIE